YSFPLTLFFHGKGFLFWSDKEVKRCLIPDLKKQQNRWKRTGTKTLSRTIRQPLKMLLKHRGKNHHQKEHADLLNLKDSKNLNLWQKVLSKLTGLRTMSGFMNDTKT